MHPWETALVTYAACVGLNVLLSVAAIFKYAHFRKTSRSSLLVDALLVTTTVTFLVPPFGIFVPIMLFVAISRNW